MNCYGCCFLGKGGEGGGVSVLCVCERLIAIWSRPSRSVGRSRLGVSGLSREQKLCFAVRGGDGDGAVGNKALGEKIPFDVVDSHVMGRTGVANDRVGV